MVLVELLSGYITGIIHAIGYPGVFILMTLESALLPVPSEIIMPYSGFFVATGEFNLYLVILVGTLGNLLGSLIAYFLGVRIGRTAVLKYGKYVFIHKSHLDMADSWFKRFGEWIIFVGRNLPAIRTYISLPAGISRMNIWKFSIYTSIGSIPWNFALTYIGVILGRNWDVILKYTTIIDVIIVMAVLIAFVWWVKKRK